MRRASRPQEPRDLDCLIVSSDWQSGELGMETKTRHEVGDQAGGGCWPCPVRGNDLLAEVGNHVWEGGTG